MDDGAEVYKSVFQNYSDIARTEEMVNIHQAHRRRLEFCSLLGTTSGGKSHPNMQEHHVFFERQRRKLEAGVRCKGHFQCFYKGRLVTVHDPVIHRNEFHRTLDHPEVMKQGIMGLKNIHSMGPFLHKASKPCQVDGAPSIRICLTWIQKQYPRNTPHKCFQKRKNFVGSLRGQNTPKLQEQNFVQLRICDEFGLTYGQT